jgi:hypothetical protein
MTQSGYQCQQYEINNFSSLRIGSPNGKIQLRRKTCLRATQNPELPNRQDKKRHWVTFADEIKDL